MENTEFQRDLKQLTNYTALTCFVIGTLLFLSGMLFKHLDTLFLIGYFYVIIAFIINALLVAVLLLTLIINQKDWLFYLKRILVLLANVPAVILYLYLLF
ncbi:hypothetical protein [Flavobacterium pedocola]